MTTKPTYDAGHLSFIEIIKVITELSGPAFAKGALFMTGLSVASTQPVIEFATLDDFIKSANKVENPISHFEGRARHHGDGVFGLKSCPFAESIEAYTALRGELPAAYDAVVTEINRPKGIAESLRVGHGAAVNPFCAVHQPIRSALGERIKVAGRFLRVYQLGCRSSTGVKGLADRWIAVLGIKPELVDRILDEDMCCYALRFSREESSGPMSSPGLGG